MTGETKRIVAYGSAVAVTLGVFVAIWVDYRREPVWLANPPQLGAPILVGISPGLREHEGDIIQALAQMNRETECTVFSLTTEANAKAVLKWVDTDACDGRAGPLPDRLVEGMVDCKNGTAEVHFRDLADPNLRFSLIVHALGHVAGLAHDTSGDSVMLDPPPPMAAGKLAPGLTRKDARALKEKFCP